MERLFSPDSLYNGFIKEFQRLKEQEQQLLGWTAKRELAKINYHIHTDAVKHNLIPLELTPQQVSIIYANEADVLNMALFGKTALQWRKENGSHYLDKKLVVQSLKRFYIMSKKFSGIVEMFDKCNMPWWYVRVPKKISSSYEILADRGLIAVTASVGKNSWETSLLPYGDKTHFIALPAKVRKANDIKLGDKISIEFEIRKRK